MRQEIDQDLTAYDQIYVLDNNQTPQWRGLVIGENCFIMEGTIIEPFVRIG